MGPRVLGAGCLEWSVGPLKGPRVEQWSRAGGDAESQERVRREGSADAAASGRVQSSRSGRHVCHASHPGPDGRVSEADAHSAPAPNRATPVLDAAAATTADRGAAPGHVSSVRPSLPSLLPSSSLPQSAPMTDLSTRGRRDFHPSGRGRACDRAWK